MSERGGRDRGRTGPVTPEAVIDAALRVIDDDGLDALTMRRLAHDLSVEPVTVYRQLPNKEAILAGVAEKLWREMTPPDTGGDADGWKEQVRGMWLSLNELMQRHPNAIPIIARGGTYSSAAGAGTTEMMRVLRDAGLSPAEAAELLHILSACVVGFGFATLWGRQAAAGLPHAASARVEPVSGDAAGGDDDLTDYLRAMMRWEPAQFSAAVDIVLGAYGDAAER